MHHPDSSSVQARVKLYIQHGHLGVIQVLIGTKKKETEELTSIQLDGGFRDGIVHALSNRRGDQRFGPIALEVRVGCCIRGSSKAKQAALFDALLEFVPLQRSTLRTSPPRLKKRRTGWALKLQATGIP